MTRLYLTRDPCVSRAVAIFAAVSLVLATSGAMAEGDDEDESFTRKFRLADCSFQTTGTNPYFLLQPGHTLTLEGVDDGLAVKVVVTVLEQTREVVLPTLGSVLTRVVEEREWKNGELVERSLNFFASCEPTNDVYYFGEDVDIFEPDGTIVHDGAWLAGKHGAKPGIIMPGTMLLGSRYYQELAAGVALDRAEHERDSVRIRTPAGTFTRCARIVETTPLEPGHESIKVYCPGIGLVMDGDARLTSYSTP
jgi:hypothetical protein